MSFIQCLRCRPAGAILSPDRWASVGVWVTATGSMLRGALRTEKSRWDFSGDSPTLSSPLHPERFR